MASYCIEELPVPRGSGLQEASLQAAVPKNKYKPTVVGWFTKDEDGGFRGEDSNFLKYLHLPKNSRNVHFDLSKFNDDDQFNLPIRKFAAGNIDSLLYWIKGNAALSECGSAKKPSADFICYRNVFSLIMKMPFEKFEEFRASAVKINGTIYMCQFECEKQRMLDELQTAKHIIPTKQGLKFQQFLLSESQDEVPDPSKPYVRDDQEIDVVLEGVMGDHSLLYASKIKGLPDADSIHDLQSASLFDLRTNANEHYSWIKLVNWWTGSIMGKIDNMIVGIRGEHGLVETLDVISTSSLMHKMQNFVNRSVGEGRGWHRGRGNARGYRNQQCNPNHQNLKVESQCFAFLNQFLTYVKKNVVQEGEIYHLTWSPSCQGFLECTKLSEEDKATNDFVPTWYKQWLNNCK